MENTTVSVFLLTYNHKDYIEQAINSILSQKTSYNIEIVIHDDASSDGTSEIVKRYADTYPSVIIPVIQKENQYEKGFSHIFRQFVYPRMKGEYVAFLEGDDYWSDENKIQKQTDYLNNHLDYVATAHNTRLVNVESGEEKLLNEYADERDLTLQDIVENGIHSFHLNSVVFRKNAIDDYPDFMDIPKGFFLDLSLRLLLISKGKIHYSPEAMSCYRYLVPGSSSKRITAIEKRIEEYRVIVDLFKAVDEFQGRENHRLFEKKIIEYEYKIAEARGNNRELLQPFYREIWLSKPFIYRVKKIIKAKLNI